MQANEPDGCVWPGYRQVTRREFDPRRNAIRAQPPGSLNHGFRTEELVSPAGGEDAGRHRDRSGIAGRRFGRVDHRTGRRGRATPPDKVGGLSRWAKRESALTQLQEGYERVNQLIADMQKHMAEAVATHRAHVHRRGATRPGHGRGAESFPASRPVRSKPSPGNLKPPTARPREVADAVGEIPQGPPARRPRPCPASAKRLDMMNEQSVVGNQAMEKLNSALTSVSQSGQLQADLLRQIDARASEQNQRLNDMLDSQRRRFTNLFIAAIMMALIAVAMAAAILPPPLTHSAATTATPLSEQRLDRTNTPSRLNRMPAVSLCRQPEPPDNRGPSKRPRTSLRCTRHAAQEKLLDYGRVGSIESVES